MYDGISKKNKNFIVTSVSKFMKTDLYKSKCRLGFLFFYFNVSVLSKLGAAINVLKATGMCERQIKRVNEITLRAVGQHVLLQSVLS